VPDLLSRAELAATGGSLLDAGTLAAFAAAARRLQRAADARFAEAAAAGFPGCLRLWEVGDVVLAPLLEAHSRVAVLVVPTDEDVVMARHARKVLAAQS